MINFVGSVLFVVTSSICVHNAARSKSNRKGGTLMNTTDTQQQLPYIARQSDVSMSRSSSSGSEDGGQVHFECERLSEHIMRSRAIAFHTLQNQRRSIRFMSTDNFPIDILLSCIATAGCAPSGAHQQPWHFSIISSKELKKTNSICSRSRRTSEL